ncbi:MAG: hypothetical protein ACI4V7_06290 [Succinivibrionaceae bacterium]
MELLHKDKIITLFFATSLFLAGSCYAEESELSSSLGGNEIYSYEPLKLTISGIYYNVYPTFKIGTKIVSPYNDFEEGMIGIFKHKPVYMSDEIKPHALAFLVPEDKKYGVILMDSIDYKCESSESDCLNIVPNKIADSSIINSKKNYYRITFTDYSDWYEGYLKLLNSTEVVAFSPLIDFGVLDTTISVIDNES